MLMSRFLKGDALFSRAESLRAKTKEPKWQQTRKKLQINKIHFELCRRAKIFANFEVLTQIIKINSIIKKKTKTGKKSSLERQVLKFINRW